jgi:polyphenol oxidase
MDSLPGNKNILISLGNAQTSPFSISEFKSLIGQNKSILREKIESKTDQASYFLHQTHGIDGHIVKSLNEESLSLEGDFIATDNKNLAIGVLTADCLPIIFYDNENHVAAIAHAGWKGTTAQIAQVTFEKLKKHFNTDAKNLEVVFGPSAKICCYEVGIEFEKSINDLNLKNKTLIKKNDKYFFDLPLYNKLLLQDYGINNINLNYNICTICNPSFCSYRRDKEKSGLQMTTIMLK